MQRPAPRPQLFEDLEAAGQDLLQARHDTEGEPEADPDVLLPADEAYAEIIGGPFDATDFDFRHPDYSPIFQRRTGALAILRERLGLLVPVKQYYADNPADFITDWANTFNPLNPGPGLPTTLPFVLFERQREWIDYVLRKWRNRERGLTEKSREVGMSWLAVGLSCTMCLFNREFVIGFGSYKKEYVDEAGSPSSLFWKARFFIEHLPQEFRGSWDKGRHAPQFRIFFPDTGSVIFGDVGDELGRGGRSALFFVDEAARLAHPELVEASLSFTTNCRMDISTPNGLANQFYQNRGGGRIEVFTFPWRSDPRKDDDWYAEQKEHKDPVILAQEVDIDYSASVEGIIIPHVWVMAAIDAAEKLRVPVTGAAFGALDLGDEGGDLNAFCD